MDSPDQESNTSKEDTPKLSGFRVLDRVVGENLWRLKNNEGEWLREPEERIPNSHRVTEIAKEEVERANKPQEQAEINLPQALELNQKVPDLVEGVITQAIEEGWLLKEAVDLTERLSRIQDIQVVENQQQGLNLDLRIDQGVFPEEDEENRPNLTIGYDLIKARVNYFRDIATRSGLDLTPEQLVSAALASAAVHEWSHSIEKAFQTKLLSVATGLTEYIDEGQNFWNVTRMARRVLYDLTKEATAPILNHLSDEDAGMASVEQFATGVETEAIRISLEQTELSKEQAEHFVAIHKQDQQERLKEFALLREKLNLTDQDLETLCLDVRSILKGRDIKTYIPDLWKGIGYFSPYSQAELKNIITGALDKVDNHEQIRAQMIEMRQDQL